MGFIVAVGLAIPCAIHAQKVEITPFGGRQFGGALNIRTGELNIPAAWNYGLVIDIPTGPGAYVEVLYARQETLLEERVDATGMVTTLFDMAVEHFQVGVLYEPEFFRTTRPFASLTGGVTHYDAQEPGRSGEWRFSGGFAGGVKRLLTPHVGVRADARILFTFLGSVREIFCSTSAGCLTGVEGAIVAQGLLTGGVTLSF
jgi:hypothetical protein